MPADIDRLLTRTEVMRAIKEPPIPKEYADRRAALFADVKATITAFEAALEQISVDYADIVTRKGVYDIATTTVQQMRGGVLLEDEAPSQPSQR